MKIYSPGGSLVRVIDDWYPQSEYIWDGTNGFGALLPESSGVGNSYKYKAVINAVSNSCNHISYPIEKYFHLKRKYTVFNPLISNTIIDVGVIPTIHFLDNVHHLKINLSNADGAIIYTKTILNPPSSIGISTAFGDPNGLPQVSPGLYPIKIECSNNCESFTVFSGNVEIFDVNNYLGTTSTLLDWTPVSKPEYDCPFLTNYVDNYLPPRDCCEGSLYIDNVDIYSSWNVNILNNIYIGENANFQPSSTTNLSAGQNILFAGQSIVVSPGSTSVLIGPTTYLHPGIYNCALCIIESEDTNSEIKDVYPEYLVSESILIDTVEFILSPNPSKAGRDIKIHSLSGLINDNVRISMFSSIGAEISVELINISKNEVTFKTLNKLSQGIYFVNIESNGYYEHFILHIE